jgi:Uma2 family endonuclease
MAHVQQARATFEDLYREPGKAELLGGRIVRFMATGHKPHRVAFRIARSLDDYAAQTGSGEAYGDNMGFAVPLLPSGRESFSPDAAYYTGPLPADSMRFVEGAPTLAVEVRSENDYGPAAEAELAEKRADYFMAGTLVVWDVDCLAECIHVYRATAPTQPLTYCRGQLAVAEPAVPGWQLAVDAIFKQPL